MGKLDADNWQELIQSIKSKGMRPGVSLRPGTPVEEVFPLVRQYSLQLLNLSCYNRKETFSIWSESECHAFVLHILIGSCAQ